MSSPIPNWLAPFCPTFRDAVAPLAVPAADRRVACFDADGTLWTEDQGEAFLRWLLAGRLLDVDYARDTYAEYEERTRRDLVDGYRWGVQVMAGLVERDVALWADQLAAAWPTYRQEMTGLLRGLDGAGVEVWIVSASNVWTVRSAARRLGLDTSRIIGVEVELASGRLTDRIVEPMPCMAGKVAAIRARIGKLPDLACGDGLGDLEMLESAAQPLVVGCLGAGEKPLLRIARERGWPLQLF